MIPKGYLYTKIFRREEEYHDDQWDDILDKITKNCGGIPLALLTVASILTRTPREEWHKVLNNAFDCETQGGSDMYNLRKILLHSYYQLPSHLRPCFLNLSMFPEDCEFRRDRLVWRWVAEGFIQGKQGCSLFQIGQKYFEELLNRGLILQVDKDDVSGGKTKYCHVHDMVLNLSCSLASDENFVTILIDGQEQRIFGHKVIRRLSLQSSLLGRTADTLDVGKHVRSVGVFGTGNATTFKLQHSTCSRFGRL